MTVSQYMYFMANTYVRVFSSAANKARYEDMMLDLHRTFGFFTASFVKCENNKSKKLSKWLINSFSSVVIDHIKRNHPIIFHETFYVTYCKSIHDDLCGRYYVITDDDTPIDVSLCTFNNPHTIIDINDMQLVEINKLSNPTINELSESKYSNLVSGVTDIVSKRFVHQSLDIQTKQERLALINLISIKLVNKLIDSIGEIQPNTIDQKQVNKHLEEFINGFDLDEDKKT